MTTVPVVFSPAPTGYYLDGDCEQPFPEKVWCSSCGTAAAFHYRRRKGMRELQIRECWTGDDRVMFCAGCRKMVDTGSLTTYAINEEFDALVGCPPDGTCLELAQILNLLLVSMADDDPRTTTVAAWFNTATGSTMES